MLAICVDDERLALEALKTELAKTPRVRLLAQFLDPNKALEYIKHNYADLALLDINIGGGFNGLELARRIREIRPATRIIFTTGYIEYAFDAIQMHVSGYLLKPVTVEDINRELDEIETVPPPLRKDARLYVQCFGNFDVFHDGKPLKFKRQKSRELFAYLIDKRGATAALGELCAVLWPDKPGGVEQRTHLRSLVFDLMNTLRDCGAENAVVKTRGAISVVPEMLDCDYYRLLKGDVQAINAYRGEYMTQYEWSELTLSGLESARK